MTSPDALNDTFPLSTVTDDSQFAPGDRYLLTRDSLGLDRQLPYYETTVNLKYGNGDGQWMFSVSACQQRQRRPDTDYCRLFPDCADPGVGAYR